MAYDLSVLDDKEFEEFARDLLNSEFKLDLQSFKKGKDGGIDLRQSTATCKNDIVVQAKHYSGSGYKVMLSDLKASEVSKVKSLHPNRYIFITSVPLSAANKDQICKLFHPYIQSANDVLGKEDILKYLGKHKDILQKWHKLWLTSTDILQTILNNAVLGRSAFTAEKIQETIRRYVVCTAYDQAMDILQEHHYLLITGQPGVGKTTLAYILSYELLSQGYELIYIDGDVKEAEGSWNPDPKVKQFFFFDDFLGANYLEITHPKTTESGFVDFVKRIQGSPNRYLILTTRTSIFHTAVARFEKMKRARVDTARKEIELGQYTLLDKAKILYRHIYHSGLTVDQKEQLLKDKYYWKIIEHKSYNPRLIEFITDPANIPSGINYVRFVQQNLGNPTEVWNHAYSDQLEVEDRLLLHAVFSQPRNADAEVTLTLFKQLLEHEIAHHHYRAPANPFQRALKKLLDGILTRVVFSKSHEESIHFINPSLPDFLTHYFIQCDEERDKLLAGSSFIEQIERYAESFFGPAAAEVPDIGAKSSKFARQVMSIAGLLDTLEKHPVSDRPSYIHLRMAAKLAEQRYLDDSTCELVEQFVLDAFRSYPLKNLSIESRKYFISIVKYPLTDTIRDYVYDHWNKIMHGLFTVSFGQEECEDVMYLFNEYGIEFDSFIAYPANKAIVRMRVIEFVNEYTDDWLQDKKNEVLSIDDWESLKVELKEERDALFSQYNLKDNTIPAVHYFDDEDMGQVIEDNLDRKRNPSGLTSAPRPATDEDEDIVKAVEVLFTGQFDPAFVAGKARELNLPF